MNKSSKRYGVLLCLCVLCSISCARQLSLGNVAYAAETPAAQSSIAVPAVKSVLDGTDLIDLSALKLLAAEKIRQGKYSSEEGGSQLELTVSRKGKQWTIKRRYEEPELKARTKVYKAEVNGPVLVSGKKDFYMQVTSDGLLVLELHSGLDSIPASYWILYRPVLSQSK